MSSLSALHSSAGLITLLQLDVASQLAQVLGLELGVEQNDRLIKTILTQLTEKVSEHASGVVLDPIYSLPVWQRHSSQPSSKSLAPTHSVQSKPWVLRLDEPIAGAELPKLIPNWGVEEIAQNYALATLELWYDPTEPQAVTKKQLVAELYHHCHLQNTELLIKLHVTTLAPPEKMLELQEAQLTAIQELRSVAHALLLDFPGSALAAATISAELDIPWLLNLEASTYEEAKNQLRAALENGAQGCVVGQQLWRELSGFAQPANGVDVEAVSGFISTTVRDRLIEIRRIVDETAELT